MKNIFQAGQAYFTFEGRHKRIVVPAVYPTVPAIWPNRAIRRALRFGKTIPQQWHVFFEANPEHRALAKQQASR
jgi:hypothetical protein